MANLNIVALTDKIENIFYKKEVYSFNDVLPLFNNCLPYFISDYSTYRKHWGKVLSVFEKYETASIPFLDNLYLYNYKRLVNNQHTITEIPLIFDPSLCNSNTNIKFEKLYSSYVADSKNKIVYGLSDVEIDKKPYSNTELIEIATFLNDLIQTISPQSISNAPDKTSVINIFAAWLGIFRDILKSLNSLEPFYFLCGKYVDLLCGLGMTQAARNFAEGIIKCSFIDGCVHLGFYVAYKCHTNTSAILISQFYGSVGISAVFINNMVVSSQYLRKLSCFTLQYYCRWCIPEDVNYVNNLIPSYLNFKIFEIIGNNHCIFMNKFKFREKDLVVEVFDFLNTYEIEITSSRPDGNLPWLVLLYNLKITYKDEFDASNLNRFIIVLEANIPRKMYVELKAMVDLEVGALQKHLKERIIRLKEVHDSEDVMCDLNEVVVIANRLVLAALKSNDIESILIAMIVISDFSFTFSGHNTYQSIPFEVTENEVLKFDKYYGTGQGFLSRHGDSLKNVILWVFISEKKLFVLSYYDNSFQCVELKDFNYLKFCNFKNPQFYRDLEFIDSETTKSTGNYWYNEDDFKEKSNIIQRDFEFMSYDITFDNRPILIITDISISNFPHNLYGNSLHQLHYLTNPVCHITSTDWYLENAGKNLLESNYSKSVWAPTIGGDIQTNMIFQSLEEFFSKSNFTVSNSFDVGDSLHSDLNIIVSHGDDDIHSIQVFNPNSCEPKRILDLTNNGKILILIVCHSGTSKKSSFKHNIESVSRQFMKNGYKNVIAPCWGLGTDIPPVWLPEFFNFFNNGVSITEAVHKANLAVHHKYPILTASACMHLFGDPEMSVYQS